jgi:hypothetical protein
MMIDEPDIDSIIAAVGKAPANKGELLSDLEGAVSLYRHGVGLRHQPSERRRELKRTITLAMELKSRLCGDARFNRLCAELDRVCALTEAEWLPNLLGINKKVSAFDNLIGFMLYRTFERHFGIKDRYTKNVINGKIEDGPFIRFAKKVLSEFEIKNSGKPYTRRAIADALTKGSRHYRQKREKRPHSDG